MNTRWATEVFHKRAGFTPRGELSPEQAVELEAAKGRWFPQGGNATAPATSGVSSPWGPALAHGAAGGILGGAVGLFTGGPVGAAVSAPVGALMGGVHGYSGQAQHNELVEEAMRRGATSQYDIDSTPQANSRKIMDQASAFGLSNRLQHL